MSREFVYATLNVPSITDFVQDRILQQSSVLDGQMVKPFLVYTMGNNTDEEMSDPDNFTPSRQFFQVYIHDEVGDYSRIDDMVRVIKAAFLAAKPSLDVCGVQYLETSRDLDDPTLQSIMRYMRFQLAKSR